MNRIEVQKIPQRKAKPGDILAEFCYYYPQYTFAQARKLPEIHVRRLLKTARRIKASDFLSLTQIAAAPHSKDGVDKLISHYQGLINE